MCLTASKISCVCEGTNSWACVWHSAAELHFSAPTSCCLSLLQRTRVQRDPGDQDHRGGKKKPLVLEIVFTFLIDGRPANSTERQAALTLPTFWMCLAVDCFCFKPRVWFSLLAQFSGMRTTEIFKARITLCQPVRKQELSGFERDCAKAGECFESSSYWKAAFHIALH